MLNKNKKTSTSKGLSYWLLVLSILILSVATAWTAYVGQKTIAFSNEQSLVVIQKPLFKEYLTELGIQIPEQPASSATNVPSAAPQSPVGAPAPTIKDRKIEAQRTQARQVVQANQVGGVVKPENATTLAPVQKIFSDLRFFENRRTELVFKKIEPVVAKVERGSLAEDLGFKKTDVIKSVGSNPVSSVWDFYQFIDEAPAQQLSFTVGRGKKQIKIVATESSDTIYPNKLGLLFVIPKGLSYISKGEAIDLSNQFEERFIQVVGADFRKDYVESLGSFSAGLVALPVNQDVDLNKYEKLNTSAMLTWHHEKFLVAIEKFHADIRTSMAQQSTVVAAFQEALFGFAAAFLLFGVAFVIRARVVAKESVET